MTLSARQIRRQREKLERKMRQKMSDQPQEAPKPSKRELLQQEILNCQNNKEQALAQANFWEGKRQGSEEKLALYDELVNEKAAQEKAPETPPSELTLALVPKEDSVPSEG